MSLALPFLSLKQFQGHSDVNKERKKEDKKFEFCNQRSLSKVEARHFLQKMEVVLKCQRLIKR